MNKFVSCVALLVCALFICACTMKEDLVKRGTTFKDLQTFYIDAPIGGDSIFYAVADRTAYDAFLISKIREKLESEGFGAAERDAAQFIVRPMWNTRTSISNDGLRLNETLSFGTRKTESSCTLQIQIFFQGGDEWVWRGFSSEEINSLNLSDGALANQVYWCLEKFPPEKHPSMLDTFHMMNQPQAEDGKPADEPTTQEEAATTAPAQMPSEPTNAN